MLECFIHKAKTEMGFDQLDPGFDMVMLDLEDLPITTDRDFEFPSLLEEAGIGQKTLD